MLAQASQLSRLVSADSILEYVSREARRLVGAPLVATSYARAGDSWPRGIHLVAQEECKAASPAVVSASFAIARRLSARPAPLELHHSAEVAPIFKGLGAEPGSHLWALPLFNGRKRLVGQLVLLSRAGAPLPEAALAPLLALVQLSSLALDAAQRLAFARRDQERLLLLAAATEEALWDWELESNAFWWGGGILSLVRSNAELIGSTVGWKLERIHPADAGAVQASLDAALTGAESTWRQRYRFRRGDGSWAVVDDRGYFMRDENGRAYRMFGAIRDVSDETWREQQQRFLIRASAELAGTLVIGASLSSVVASAAESVADHAMIILFEPFQGEAPLVTVGACDAERARSLESAVRALVARRGAPIGALASARVFTELGPGAARELTERYFSEDPHTEHRGELAALIGAVKPISVLHAPLLIGAQAIGCITLVAAESSTLRYTSADLAFVEELARRCSVAVEKSRLYEQLQNAVRSRDAFMAILGHELRNPLAPITTALHLMKLRDPRARREQEVIERQVKHLTRLVDDLLDISRIERGKVELSKKPLQLAELVAKAVEMTSPLLEQRRHRLELQVPPSGLPVLVDETRMGQVIANLLTNSARYTPEGGRIWLRAHRQGESVVLSVQDNGLGISADFLPHIFDLFAQGPRTIDRHQGGLGLGLSLVRSFVTLHGGSVEARSEGLSRGSEFIIRLPALPDAIDEGDAVPAPQTIEVCARRVQVLVVDDNRDAAELLGELLCARGHEVVVAHDGPSALALLPKFQPDFAILDIGLPVMDGYELAPRIVAALPRRPTLIALTGYGQHRDRQQAREAGFDEHMTKPVDPERLMLLLEGATAPR